MTLFDLPPVFAGRSRRGDPETSREAAKSVSGRTEQRIVKFLQNAGYYGLTCDDLVRAFGPTAYKPTIASALARCHKAGTVRDSGRKRDSLRGRESIVWVIA